MTLWDTHAHLTFSPLAEQLPAVLARACAVGVTTILAPAYDRKDWERLAALQAPGVYKAFGLHPWAANDELDLDVLAERLRLSGVVAVGEIGLDGKVEVPMARQREVFLAQVELALSLDLPVLLHARGAYDALFEALAPYRGRVRGVWHAFSRGPEMMKRALDLGLHIALGGAITRPNAKQVQQVAKRIPLDRLLFETDAPSIGLETVAPGQVEPRHVAEIAAAFAACRGLEPADVAALSSRNARRLFLREAS